MRNSKEEVVVVFGRLSGTIALERCPHNEHRSGVYNYIVHPLNYNMIDCYIQETNSNKGNCQACQTEYNWAAFRSQK